MVLDKSNGDNHVTLYRHSARLVRGAGDSMVLSRFKSGRESTSQHEKKSV
jgi:hypothetical protein